MNVHHRAAAAVLITGLAAFGLTSCANNLDTPEGVAKAYLDAMAEGDVNTALNFVEHSATLAVLEEGVIVDDPREYGFTEGIKNIKVGDTREIDGEATAQVSFSIADREYSAELHMAAATVDQADTYLIKQNLPFLDTEDVLSGWMNDDNCGDFACWTGENGRGFRPDALAANGTELFLPKDDNYSTKLLILPFGLYEFEGTHSSWAVQPSEDDVVARVYLGPSVEAPEGTLASGEYSGTFIMTDEAKSLLEDTFPEVRKECESVAKQMTAEDTQKWEEVRADDERRGFTFSTEREPDATKCPTGEPERTVYYFTDDDELQVSYHFLNANSSRGGREVHTRLFNVIDVTYGKEHTLDQVELREYLEDDAY